MALEDAPLASREIEFALDRFVADDGLLVVEGRWYGVLGRRFVRPVLMLEGRRRLIAVMEHKPWHAEEGRPWIAAFAHSGGAGAGRLQVAPDVAGDLPPAGPGAGRGERLPARVARPTVSRYVRPEPVEEELVDPLRADLDSARSELATLRADLEAAREELKEAQAARDSSIDEIDRLRADADRERVRADTLEQERQEARFELERLRSDVQRLQATADQALAERNRARDELQLQRFSRQPYVAPRPVQPFSDAPPHVNWPLRIASGVTLVLVVLLALGLLGSL